MALVMAYLRNMCSVVMKMGKENPSPLQHLSINLLNKVNDTLMRYLIVVVVVVVVVVRGGGGGRNGEDKVRDDKHHALT